MKNVVIVIIAWILAITLAFPVFIIMLFFTLFSKNKKIDQYLINVSIGIDQMGASLLNWNPDTTVSGNIGYRISAGKATLPEKILCSFLQKLEVKHCMKNIEPDEKYEERK